MALTSKSLFLYGLQITDANKYIDFQIVGAGPTLTATLEVGYYSLTELLNAIKTKMESADPTNLYSASADRTISGGTENRVTISTTGAYLSLLFALEFIRLLLWLLYWDLVQRIRREQRHTREHRARGPRW